MDFVKNLLIYMALTLTTSLQAAPTPGTPPAETPYVSSAVEELPGDNEGTRIVGSYVVTPGPVTPTPLPTITPNIAYTTLAVNSRGEDVRRLQSRLVELGYLQGNVDGAYGYQTRNAVMLFQEVNGLQKDGVAGRSTLTRLYEDPDVIPNPAVITPSPEPTSTPDAEGIIPVPEDPVSGWLPEEKAKVMLNGYMQTVPETGKAPRVWKRGGSIIVSLSDLFSALEMDVTATGGKSMAFTWADYAVNAVMSPALSEDREDDDPSFAQLYDVTVDGQSVELSQGDLMYEDGQWYATTDFLFKTVHATGRWDEEEKTLMLVIQDKALYMSVD